MSPITDEQAAQAEDADFEPATLAEEISPVEGAQVVKAGGREATPDPKPAGKKPTGKKASSSTARKPAAKKESKPRGHRPNSTLALAEDVLRKADGPLHVKEITARIMKRQGHGLKGATPVATVGALLAVNEKLADSVFTKTDKATFTVKGKK